MKRREKSSEKTLAHARRKEENEATEKVKKERERESRT